MKSPLTAGALFRWYRTLKSMGFTVVPFGQGFKDMSPPTKELMKLTLGEEDWPTAVIRCFAG